MEALKALAIAATASLGTFSAAHAVTTGTYIGTFDDNDPFPGALTP